LIPKNVHPLFNIHSCLPADEFHAASACFFIKEYANNKRWNNYTVFLPDFQYVYFMEKQVFSFLVFFRNGMKSARGISTKNFQEAIDIRDFLWFNFSCLKV